MSYLTLAIGLLALLVAKGFRSWLFASLICVFAVKAMLSGFYAARVLRRESTPLTRMVLSKWEWSIGALGFGVVFGLLILAGLRGEGWGCFSAAFLYRGFAVACLIAGGGCETLRNRGT